MNTPWTLDSDGVSRRMYDGLPLEVYQRAYGGFGVRINGYGYGGSKDRLIAMRRAEMLVESGAVMGANGRPSMSGPVPSYIPPAGA